MWIWTTETAAWWWLLKELWVLFRWRDSSLKAYICHNMLYSLQSNHWKTGSLLQQDMPPSWWMYNGWFHHNVPYMCISIVRHFIGTNMDAQVVSNTTLLNIFSFFHWHYHQYRNKIPLKQENAAMLYQLETFTTLKFCMFIHRTCCQEKIYFHIIIFFSYSV